jgi:hypothetical protein
MCKTPAPSSSAFDGELDLRDTKSVQAAAPAGDIFDEPVPQPEEQPFQPGQFTDADTALKFILGGNATVTVRSKRSGNRFTFKVEKSDDDKMFFVKLLVGPDNYKNYKYFGHVFANNQKNFYHGREGRAKIEFDAPGAKAFRWSFDKLVNGTIPEELEIWHEGRCGRCGRKLTVPHSIATGFGPECAGRMGL